MKVKIIRTVLIIFLIILIPLILWGPKLYLKILEKKINKVSIIQTKIRNDNIETDIKVDISEKWIPFLIDSMSYRTELFDTIISEGTKRFEDNERKRKELVIPVRVHHELLEENIKHHQGDSVEVLMHIRHYLDFPILGKRTVDVMKRVHMKLPVIPTVTVTDVKVADVGLDDLQMLVTVSVDNPNNMDLVIAHMKTSVKVKDYAASYTESDVDFHIKKFATSEVQVPVNTDLKNELKAFWKTFSGETEWPYYLKTEMVLIPGDSRIDSIDITSEKQGKVDVKEALKAMKNKDKVGVDENN